jgi:hypothetical protein
MPIETASAKSADVEHVTASEPMRLLSRAGVVRLGRRQKWRRRAQKNPNAPRAFADPPSLLIC